MILSFTAFFDANVFYGARLRSLILFLAQTKLFRARWSNAVHDEWIGNLLHNRPDLTREALARTRRLMDEAVLDGLVVGYETLIPGLELPDPGDRHILAAAIVAKASCIVTFNLEDFPAGQLGPYGLHAVHPDEFLLDVQSIDPVAFATAVRADLSHYQQPSLGLADYVAALTRAGVPRIAAEIASLAIILEGPAVPRRED